MDINKIDEQLKPIETNSNSRQYGMMGLALHNDLKDRLKTYSRKINVPMSKIIRVLITSYLDEKEMTEEIKSMTWKKADKLVNNIVLKREDK